MSVIAHGHFDHPESGNGPNPGPQPVGRTSHIHRIKPRRFTDAGNLLPLAGILRVGLLNQMRVGQRGIERPGNVQDLRNLHDTRTPFAAYWLVQFGPRIDT